MSGHLATGHLGVDDDRFLFPLFVDLEVGRDDSCLAGDSFPVIGRLDILTGQVDQQAAVVTDIVDQGLGLPLFPEIGDNTFGQVRHLCIELHPVGLDQIERPKGAVTAGSDLKMLLGKQELLCREIGGLQVLEYDRSFLAARILFDRFNGSIIISGAFGLFKKSVVIDAGGYDTATMGEDMELVVKLHVFCREHNLPYRIRYATDAICWTQAPEHLSDLRKQRRRWHIGLFESMSRHRRILANPKYGLVSFVSYLYFLIYELLSPYIEIFGVFTIALAFAVDLINVPFMILFFLIYVVYSAILSLTAFFARIHTVDLKLTPLDVLKAVGLCALEVSCLRFILAWVRATALIGYQKKKQSWGQIQRQKINFE